MENICVLLTPEDENQLTCILLYLLKVLLHMEQANCIGPTRICAGVGIQNLLSWLKEQPWTLFFKGSSCFTWKTFFSLASGSSGSGSPVWGNPMCKATVTCSTFSFTSRPSLFTPWSSLKGKNWIVSWERWSCWAKEEGGGDIELVREEDGLSHSIKVGVWRYRFLFSTLHSLKLMFLKVQGFVKFSTQKKAYIQTLWKKACTYWSMKSSFLFFFAFECFFFFLYFFYPYFFSFSSVGLCLFLFGERKRETNWWG